MVRSFLFSGSSSPKCTIGRQRGIERHMDARSAHIATLFLSRQRLPRLQYEGLQLTVKHMVCFPAWNGRAAGITPASACVYITVCLSAVSICCVYLLHLSAASICCVYLLCLSAVSICCVYLLCLSAVSICCIFRTLPLSVHVGRGQHPRHARGTPPSGRGKQTTPVPRRKTGRRLPQATNRHRISTMQSAIIHHPSSSQHDAASWPFLIEQKLNLDEPHHAHLCSRTCTVRLWRPNSARSLCVTYIYSLECRKSSRCAWGPSTKL